MTPRRLFDLTIFGQLQSEVLEIRLAVLCPFVYRGFIGVAREQWSGQKETPLPNNLTERVKQWCPQYSLVWANRSTSGNQSTRDAWGSRQWAAVRHAFIRAAGVRSDVAIVSEHDEIPMPRLLARLPERDTIMATQHFYYYSGACKSAHDWARGLVLIGKTVLSEDSFMKARREWWWLPRSIDLSWHLSTFMTPKAVVNKIRHAQHTECNRSPYNKVLFQRKAQNQCIQFCGKERLSWTNSTNRDAFDQDAFPVQLCNFPLLAPSTWCGRYGKRGSYPTFPTPNLAPPLFGCTSTSKGAGAWLLGGCRGTLPHCQSSTTVASTSERASRKCRGVTHLGRNYSRDCCRHFDRLA